MNKTLMLLGGLTAALTVTSCGNDATTEVITPSTAVNFHGVINDARTSRAGNTSWTANDAIGVFMLDTAKTNTLASNYKYVTTAGNGVFAPAGSVLNFPKDGSKVSFIAYYPYAESITSLDSYPINTADQSSLEKIDLMRSVNLVNRDYNNRSNTLQFDHVLSKIVVQMTTNGNLQGIKATVNNLLSQGSYNLKSGVLSLDNSSTDSIAMNVNAQGTVAEAIVLPQTFADSLTITLQLGAISKTITTNITAVQAGERYTVNVTVNANGISTIVTPEASNYAKWTETPVISQDMMSKSNIKYITHKLSDNTSVRNFSMLYDTKLGLAYWVAYPLNSYFIGSSGRSDEWGYDPSLSSSLQPLMIRGLASGFDRGHQIPSGDRTRSRATNVPTFYYTNMTAQYSNFNQGIWASLENKVRAWYSGTDTLYVVTGALPTTPTDSNVTYTTDNNGKRIAIPKAYFKALARKVNGTFNTVGFYLEHKTGYGQNDYINYAISVTELETKTGFTFFPSIDNSIKSTYNSTAWK